MNDLTINLLSGLLGALIGAFTGIYAVRHAHKLQAEANLRDLLLEQHIKIRLSGTSDMQITLRDGFSDIYRAYQNLRCVTFWWSRKSLDKKWRAYKGNHEDLMPLFGLQLDSSSENNLSITSRQFTHQEVMKSIKDFLEYLN